MNVVRRRVPLGLLRDVVAARCEVNDSDPVDVVRRKLAAGLSVPLDAVKAVLVGRWLGFDLDDSEGGGPQAPAERMALVGRTLLVRYLRALAADAPVVVLLEDLHWADDDSLDVVADVMGSMGGDALLVVAATRAELFEHRPGWGVSDHGVSRVHLDRLTPDGARSLVREILRHADPVPDELVHLVADRADGNSFYIEELVKMLVDDGVIDASEDRWTVRIDLVDRKHVPSTLTGVLQARLDGLPAGDRRTLQRAAVIGRIFWSDAVSALGRPTRQPVDLDAAVERELVHERRPSVFAGTSEFIFRHALLHDVAYHGVVIQQDILMASMARR